MTPEERNARAARVRELLDNPEIQDAFDTTKAMLTAQWESCQSPDERENLWKSVHLLKLVHSLLRQAAVMEPTQIDPTGTVSAIRRAR